MTQKKQNFPSVSMPPELLQALDRAAAKRGWTRSFLIREIARNWLQANGERIAPDEKAS